MLNGTLALGVLSLVLTLASACGVKGPPLPPLPATPQSSEPPAPRPSASPR